MDNHEYADIFPMMDKKEYSDLKNDIKQVTYNNSFVIFCTYRRHMWVVLFIHRRDESFVIQQTISNFNPPY